MGHLPTLTTGDNYFICKRLFDNRFRFLRRQLPPDVYVQAMSQSILPCNSTIISTGIQFMRFANVYCVTIVCMDQSKPIKTRHARLLQCPWKYTRKDCDLRLH